MSVQAKEIIVTIVHGTFARGAAWTAAEGPLMELLRTSFGGSLRVQRFLWSGENSHKARDHAAWRLCELLKETRRDFPGACHFVVCHSHGGNVVLYGIRNLGYSSSVKPLDGVVCIGVPFLCCETRDLTGVLSLLAWIIPGLWFVLATPIVLMLWAGYPPDGFWGTAGRYLAAAVTIQAVPLMLHSAMKGPVASWCHSKQTRLARALHARIPDDLKMLVIWSRRDEAFVLLKGAEVVSALPFLFWNALAVALVFLGVGVAYSWYSAATLFVFESLFVSAFVTSILILIGVLLSISTNVLARLPAFWWEGLLDSTLIQLKVTQLPKGAEIIDSKQSLGTMDLHHSVLHDEPGILRGIVGWVQQRHASCIAGRRRGR